MILIYVQTEKKLVLTKKKEREVGRGSFSLNFVWRQFSENLANAGFFYKKEASYENSVLLKSELIKQLLESREKTSSSCFKLI